MKRVVLLIMIAFFFGGCASSTKLMQKGRYDAAIAKSVKKLHKNPSKEKEILVLERAYTTANELDHERVRFLKLENNPRNMEELVQTYTRLKNRQSLVRTVLPLNLPDRVVQFPYVDYDQEIVEARQAASRYFYNNALELMKRNDKESYRQAYYELGKVKEYGGDFPDVEKLSDEARYYGISRALVSVENHTHLNLPEDYTEALKTVDPSGLDNDWIEFYYHDLDKDIYFDYYLVVNLRSIVVTPDTKTEEDRMVRKRVEDGFEYVLDEDGNVLKDSLGNDVKVTKYKTLACTVIETLQQKGVVIEGDLEIYSAEPQRLIKREPVGASNRFEHKSARAVGDLEALDKEMLKLIESKQLPFPSDVEMIMRTSDMFRQAIASSMRQNKKYIF